MFRPLPIFIGLRYIRAKRRNQFISFISLTSMIGLTLGIIAMITVLSVMNGFQKEMSGRILGMVSHGTITLKQGTDNWQELAKVAKANPNVVGVAPITPLQGMLSYRGKASPILLNGIDPAQEDNVSILSKHITYGSYNDLKPDEYGLIVGEAIAATLGVRIGTPLIIIVPEASTTTPGGVNPRMQKAVVVGTFRVGADIDASLAFIHYADAAKIKKWDSDRVQGIRIQVKDINTAPFVVQSLVDSLGDQYKGEDWTKTQGSLFSAMKMEKTMIGLLLMIIVAVAAFNIIATLIMVVSDKRLDIAILRTLGATPKEIMAIFMIQGIVIGLIGIVLGTVLGILLTMNVNTVAGWIERLTGQEMFSGDVFMINYLPVDMHSSDIVMVCVAALILSFLATLFPAYRAAQTQPAEALRYE